MIARCATYMADYHTSDCFWHTAYIIFSGVLKEMKDRYVLKNSYLGIQVEIRHVPALRRKNKTDSCIHLLRPRYSAPWR